MLLSARNISRTLNLRQLFAGVSLSVDSGDRVGLIGPNGAGKSTLLKILAGRDEPDGGAIVGSKGLHVAYVPQLDLFDDDATARVVATTAGLLDPVQPGKTRDHHEAEVLADMMLDRVGFDDARADTRAGALSGGWRKRLSIACALCACGGEPDLLLLDEPTNHLDLEGIRWIEALLARPVKGTSGFASIFVTHDRTLLENIATRVVELSAAYPQGLLAVDGNYSEFLRRKEEFLSGQARAEQVIANQVRKDIAWLARGPQARRTKSKSRIDSSYARMDDLADLKARNSAAADAAVKVDFGATGRRTRKFIAARAVSKSLGGRALFKDLDLELGAGDCIGLLGPNGSGKTTLIRVLTGELAPDSGAVVRSEPPPKIAIFSQHRQDIPPTTLLRNALSPTGDHVQYRGRGIHINTWSRRFLFRDEQLEQPVSSLSGGELARVHIARMMVLPADVLVLDEPTNDLDIPTLETMEEALEDFPGALILVTHDRAMLDRLATDIIALDGRGASGRFATLAQALSSQTTQDPQPAKKSGPAAPAAAAQPKAPQRKKLTFNEQREYDTIEQRIAEAEAQAAALEARLTDQTVLADHAKMTQTCLVLGEAQQLVATLYARWEELEAKRS